MGAPYLDQSSYLRRQSLFLGVRLSVEYVPQLRVPGYGLVSQR